MVPTSESYPAITETTREQHTALSKISALMIRLTIEAGNYQRDVVAKVTREAEIVDLGPPRAPPPPRLGKVSNESGWMNQTNRTAR